MSHPHKPALTKTDWALLGLFCLLVVIILAGLLALVAEGAVGF